MARYNTPEQGTTNWHVPLNDNFAALETEVLNEVATFDDLPAPTGETSPNGVSRRYLVRDDRTIYRDAGDRWEAVVAATTSSGSGSGGGGRYPTPDGTTVAAINDALQANHVVQLVPGVTYSNNGGTIEFPANENKTVLAYGAEIEVRSNPTVLFQEGGVGGNMNGWSRWHGGIFRGSQSAGEVAFQAVDNIFGVIRPHVIQDCEVAVALTNDDLWCEFMTVEYQGHRNEIGTMLLGGDGSVPSGCSVSRPNGGGSTPSFRHLYLRAHDQIRVSSSSGALDTRYGIFMEEASPYTGFMDYTVSCGTDIVGWRYHGRMNGNNIIYHAETPSSRSGGIGMQIDKNARWASQARMRIGGSIGTKVQNNTSEPITYWDCVQEPNTAYGFRLMRDNDPMISFREQNGQHVMDLGGIDKIRLSDGSELS